jgi:hypothetical protein
MEGVPRELLPAPLELEPAAMPAPRPPQAPTGISWMQPPDAPPPPSTPPSPPSPPGIVREDRVKMVHKLHFGDGEQARSPAYADAIPGVRKASLKAHLIRPPRRSAWIAPCVVASAVGIGLLCLCTGASISTLVLTLGQIKEPQLHTVNRDDDFTKPYLCSQEEELVQAGVAYSDPQDLAMLPQSGNYEAYNQLAQVSYQNEHGGHTSAKVLRWTWHNYMRMEMHLEGDVSILMDEGAGAERGVRPEW